MRLIDLVSSVVSTIGSGLPGVNDGPGATAAFFAPWGMALNSAGTLALVVSLLFGPRRFGAVRISISSALVQTEFQDNVIRSIALPSGYVATVAGFTGVGYLDGIGPAASFYNPAGVAVNGAGTSALVVSAVYGSCRSPLDRAFPRRPDG